MIETIPQRTRQDRDISVFVALFAAYFLLILYPILRADRYYNDDLVRATLGNYGWSHNGRHLANGLMRLLELGNARVVDISPLPQLIAIGLLAWIGVLIARRFSISSPTLAVLVAFPLGAQPFFLENLSYKFDAGCMALAMLLATVPILLPKSGRTGWWIGVLLLIGCLSLYQPAINAFLVFALLEAFSKHTEYESPKSIALGLCTRGLQALIALSFYRWMVGPSLQDWVLEHSHAVNPLRDWRVVGENIEIFSGYLVDSFSARTWVLLIPLVILAGLVPSVACAWRVWTRRHSYPRWLTVAALAASAALPITALICAAGPMLLLAKPVVLPRVMIGVGALISSALIATHLVAHSTRYLKPWQVAVGGAWALIMTVHAAAYGNAAAAQDRYERAIATQLADDLAQLQARRPLRGYLVDGSAGLSPIAAHVARQFPLMGKLIFPYLHEGDFHTRNFLRPYLTRAGGVVLESLSVDAKELLRTPFCETQAQQERSAYTLYLVEDVAYVRFAADSTPGCARTSDSAP
jgi:hypothetical protein